MDELNERIEQAVATLTATDGTPYQRNAEAALRALVKRGRGEPPDPAPFVTNLMRRWLHDQRHAADGRIPSGAHPFRRYPRAVELQARRAAR